MHDHSAAASAGWHWAGTVVLALAAVVLYLAAAARARHRLQRPWPPLRVVSWVAGVGMVAAAASPPLTAAAHEQPTGHAVQHLLLGMYAPVALVLAAPVTLLLGASSTPVRRRVGAVLGSRLLHAVAHPLPAAVVGVGGLYLLYLTPAYAVTTGSPVLHAVVNVHVVLAGCVFAWSVAGPDPAPRRPGLLPRVAALLLAAAAHAYLAKLLYASAATLPPGAGYAVAQNEAAARWMYHGGDVAELLLAVALFTAWYRGRIPARRPPLRGAPGRIRTCAPPSGVRKRTNDRRGPVSGIARLRRSAA